MNVEVLALSKEKAKEEYEAWKQLVRESRVQYAKDFLSLYAHMKHGGKVVDVWEAMKTAGLNEDGDPRLAIVRADSERVLFEKGCRWINGSYVSDGGIFYRENADARRSYNRWKEDVRIPREFFPEWRKNEKGQIDRTSITALTPLIPARILNCLRSHNLANYHMLWEVEKWELAPPKDPILLKRVTSNMFLVLATWNLTKLERAVIRGRIQ
jgi:hypothetical protein